MMTYSRPEVCGELPLFPPPGVHRCSACRVSDVSPPRDGDELEEAFMRRALWVDAESTAHGHDTTLCAPPRPRALMVALL